MDNNYPAIPSTLVSSDRDFLFQTGCGHGYFCYMAAACAFLPAGHTLGMPHRSGHCLLYLFTYIYIYTHTHIYTYLYTHIYIYIYIHTHTHTCMHALLNITSNLSCLMNPTPLYVHLSHFSKKESCPNYNRRDEGRSFNAVISPLHCGF